ncbi:unnamed protein product, partial [Amoebophrya sp. A25]
VGEQDVRIDDALDFFETFLITDDGELAKNLQSVVLTPEEVVSFFDSEESSEAAVAADPNTRQWTAKQAGRARKMLRRKQEMLLVTGTGLKADSALLYEQPLGSGLIKVKNLFAYWDRFYPGNRVSVVSEPEDHKVKVEVAYRAAFLDENKKADFYATIGNMQRLAEKLELQPVPEIDMKQEEPQSVIVTDIEGSYHYFCLWIAMTPGVSLQNKVCAVEAGSTERIETRLRTCCLNDIPVSSCENPNDHQSDCARYPILHLQDHTTLVNLGDNCDHGPGCIRVQQSFGRAMREYNTDVDAPQRVYVLLGDRDVQHLKIMSEAGSWAPSYDLYIEELKLAGASNKPSRTITEYIKWFLIALSGYELGDRHWMDRKEELAILFDKEQEYVSDAAAAASFVVLAAPKKRASSSDETGFVRLECKDPKGVEGEKSQLLMTHMHAEQVDGTSTPQNLVPGHVIEFDKMTAGECNGLIALHGVAYEIYERGALAALDENAAALYTHSGPFGQLDPFADVHAAYAAAGTHCESGGQVKASAKKEDSQRVMSMIGYVPGDGDVSSDFWDEESPKKDYERLCRAFGKAMKDGHDPEKMKIENIRDWVKRLEKWKIKQLDAYRRCPFYPSSVGHPQLPPGADVGTGAGAGGNAVGSGGVQIIRGEASTPCVTCVGSLLGDGERSLLQVSAERATTAACRAVSSVEEWKSGAKVFRTALVPVTKKWTKEKEEAEQNHLNVPKQPVIAPQGKQGDASLAFGLSGLKFDDWTGAVAPEERWFFRRGGMGLIALCSPYSRFPSMCYNDHTAETYRWSEPACAVAQGTEGKITNFLKGHTPSGIAPILSVKPCGKDVPGEHRVTLMELDTSYSADTMLTLSEATVGGEGTKTNLVELLRRRLFVPSQGNIVKESDKRGYGMGATTAIPHLQSYDR